MVYGRGPSFSARGNSDVMDARVGSLQERERESKREGAEEINFTAFGAPGGLHTATTMNGHLWLGEEKAG